MTEDNVVPHPTSAAADHLEAIRRDLTLLADQARWAFGLCWENPGRGLDAERGAIHKPPSPEEAEERQHNPDFVAGDKHEIDIASHRARQAYRAATRAVATTDVYLAAILRAELIASARPLEQPPLLVDAVDYVPVATLAQACRNAGWRASRINGAGHARRLRDLRTKLDAAVRGFSPVLDQGPTSDIAHREDKQLDRGIPQAQRCEVCDLRKRGKKTGKRCPTCAQYFKRRGKERPKTMDGITPQEAQAKRLARGDSWGAA